MSWRADAHRVESGIASALFFLVPPHTLSRLQPPRGHLSGAWLMPRCPLTVSGTLVGRVYRQGEAQPASVSAEGGEGGAVLGRLHPPVPSTGEGRPMRRSGPRSRHLSPAPANPGLALSARIPGHASSPSRRQRRQDRSCGRRGGTAGGWTAVDSSRCRPHWLRAFHGIPTVLARRVRRTRCGGGAAPDRGRWDPPLVTIDGYVRPLCGIWSPARTTSQSAVGGSSCRVVDLLAPSGGRRLQGRSRRGGS